MLGVLIRKELLDNIYSLRFMVSSVICVFIIVVSVFVLRQDYAMQKEAYQISIDKGLERVAAGDDYMQLMFAGMQSARPPSKLQFLYTGVEKNPDRKTTVRSFLKPSFTGDMNFNPVFPLFPIIDLLFVVSIVMSLLAFVYTYDAVCGERERGTLKLLMSYSIPRDKVILAKWIGGYVSLVIPYIIGTLLCCAVILSSGSTLDFKGADWGAFFLTFFVALLFIAVMYSIGLFVSVISKRSATSITMLLLIWVILVLIIPNISPFVVDQIKPIDSVSKTQAEIQSNSGKQIETLIYKMLGDLEALLNRPHLLPGFTWSKFKVGGSGGGNSGSRSAGDEDKSASSGQQQQQAAQSSSASAKSSQPEVPAEAEEKARAAGVDTSSMASLIGQITDKDLRDIKAFGCRTFIDSKLKEKLNMSLETIQKQFNIKQSDLDKIMAECEIQKSKYIAELENSRQQAAAAGEGEQQGTAPQKGGASSMLQKNIKRSVKQEYGEKDFMELITKLTDKDKADATHIFYSGFLGSAKSNMVEASNIWEKREKKLDAQIAITKNISRISPISSFIYATTDLADTGIEHDKFLREKYLGDFQIAFAKYITDQLSMKYEDMQDNPQAMNIIKRPPSPKETISQLKNQIPKYTSMPLADRIKVAAADIVLLFVFAILFFMAAFYSFLKAEIIE